MSDASQGPGWWLASDGKWYPPELHPDTTAQQRGAAHAQGPGWWLASDGKWYPPELRPGPGPLAHPTSATTSQGPGWWLASDGRWYPPELHPAVVGATRAESAVATAEGEIAGPEASLLVESPVVESPVVESPVVEEPVRALEDTGPPTDPVPVVAGDTDLGRGEDEEPPSEVTETGDGEGAAVATEAPPTELVVEAEPPEEPIAPVVEAPAAAVAEEREEEVIRLPAESPAALSAPTHEPSRRARRHRRRRRSTVIVAAVVVVLAGAIAGAIVLAGSSTPTATPRPRVTTTVPTVPATGWTAADVHVVGGPVAAGDRILVIDTAGNRTMALAALDPRIGKVAWQQPFSASSVPPGVLITPATIGTTALDLAPSTSPTDPSVVLKGIDVSTGQPVWASSAPAVVLDAPVVCASQRRFCVNVSGPGGGAQLEQIDPSTGTVTATVAGPHTQMASNLYLAQAQPPGFIGVSDAAALLWSKSVAALFGSPQFSPQYGYDFVNAGPLDVGTVGVAPSPGGVEPLGSFETIGVNATTGAVPWTAQGALDCFGVIPVTPSFLCRYSGSGTYVNGNLSTAGVTLTLEGLNPATGAVTWSVPVAQAQALTTGNGVPVADPTHIVVTLASGPVLLDLGSGQTAPVPTGAVFWCGQSQQASVQAPTAALYNGRRIGVSLFAPCTAQGAAATGTPRGALPAMGVSIDGSFVWPSATGLEASPTPR